MGISWYALFMWYDGRKECTRKFSYGIQFYASKMCFIWNFVVSKPWNEPSIQKFKVKYRFFIPIKCQCIKATSSQLTWGSCWGGGRSWSEAQLIFKHGPATELLRETCKGGGGLILVFLASWLSSNLNFNFKFILKSYNFLKNMNYTNPPHSIVNNAPIGEKRDGAIQLMIFWSMADRYRIGLSYRNIRMGWPAGRVIAVSSGCHGIIVKLAPPTSMVRIGVIRISPWPQCKFTLRSWRNPDNAYSHHWSGRS